MVVQELTQIQQNYKQLPDDDNYWQTILTENAQKNNLQTQKRLKEIMKKMGFLT
jgi:hypothetical protein